MEVKHNVDSLSLSDTTQHIHSLSNRKLLDIEDLFNKFVFYLETSEQTAKVYLEALKQFHKFLVQECIKEPERKDVIVFRTQLNARCKPATVQLYIVAVRRFFAWTEQEGIYPDIARGLKSPKLDKLHKRDPLTSEGARVVLESIDRSKVRGLRDYAIIALMLTTGLRTIEVVRANVEDLRTLGDFAVLYVQGKGHTERSEYVKIVPQVERAIREYLSHVKQTCERMPLFGSLAHYNPDRMTTHSVRRMIKERLRAVGYDSDRLTAHSLRHTAATLALLNGSTLEETQQMLRHDSIETTMIYAHALERAKNNSENRIAEVLFKV